MLDHTEATSTQLATTLEGALLQLRALADKDAIRSLAALYAMAVDHHDIDVVVGSFAEHGTFSRAATTYRGHAELRAFYEKMMDRYVSTLHIPNSHVIIVDAEAGTAEGVMLGQAELSLEGRLLMATYRYDDSYTRDDDRWLFSSRDLTFMYNVPLDEMAESFTDAIRIRIPGTEPVVADYPESYATWSTYRR